MVTVLAVAALGIVAASDANTVTTHTVTRHTTVVKVTAPSSPEETTAPPTQAAAAAVPSVRAAPVTAAASMVESDLKTVVPPSPAVPAVSPTVTVTVTTTTTTTRPRRCRQTFRHARCRCRRPADAAGRPGVPRRPLPALRAILLGGVCRRSALSARAPGLRSIPRRFCRRLCRRGALAGAAIAQVESSENSGFNPTSPIYGPYRSQFLTAESNLANAPAPLVQAAAANAATACVVDIEAVLTAAAPAS